jgi:hypothetical protein
VLRVCAHVERLRLGAAELELLDDGRDLLEQLHVCATSKKKKRKSACAARVCVCMCCA